MKKENFTDRRQLLGSAAFLGIGLGSLIGGTGIASAAMRMDHESPAKPAPASGAKAASIVRLPTDLPRPVGARGPMHVTVDLETSEVTGQLADGATFQYWTFNGKVPGPFLRVRVDDTVEVRLTNPADSSMMHSVDLHSVTGPGGGMHESEAAPGETKSFTFKALKPGLYVYHCATRPAAQHIAAGMYGLILVEPAGGLEKVDHEFYVMQGEIYTEEPFGTQGELTESYENLMNERPQFFVFNGAVGALSEQHPMKVKSGETARIFFGVGGPNCTSSFHVIGEIMDKVYDYGTVTTRPMADVQTVSVPPGGAMIAEVTFEVPGKYLIVDHALSRVDKGLVAVIEVEGPPNSAVFRGGAPVKAASL
ncbi:MAG TPA: copper-containing nitrite reductase [Parvibaculum sp.]|uniref:copper-containing nitrite reductase n=1 Tax=Parvibaculum sp. TaxID=2024848 RepID=UPI002BD20F68|nr:copper-containing nitrite reductase [Parvibaculum sp.]HMM14368.1 copper-containing nitrite reductase [Parvibaculum sp.]